MKSLFFVGEVVGARVGGVVGAFVGSSVQMVVRARARLSARRRGWIATFMWPMPPREDRSVFEVEVVALVDHNLRHGLLLSLLQISLLSANHAPTCWFNDEEEELSVQTLAVAPSWKTPVQSMPFSVSRYDLQYESAPVQSSAQYAPVTSSGLSADWANAF